VVGYLPNVYEALVALLACASLGAIWSCCAPEFGSASVIDRFAQIEPKVLIAADGYFYGGKEFDRREEIERIVGGLSSLGAVLLVSKLDQESELPSCSIRVLPFSNDLGGGRVLEFAQLSFSDPLWILYSSGTTGLPKPIVQSHGGILLEHVKVLGLQSDLGPGSRFFWYSSTGWMMWNYLVGALLVGSDIVLYDGSPTSPSYETLWQLVEGLGVTYFGSSAPYLQACRRRGVKPSESFELDKLLVIGSTGAPLDRATFRWLAEVAVPNRAIASCSGGTDLCTSMLGSSPWHPTLEGRLSTRALGASVEAWSEDGVPLIGEVGELVITRPMPSMPTELYGDTTRSRLHETYFSYFPGIWRHGDWLTLFSDGSAVISGRSDATLNRGGIRMGTAEFYAVVESIAGVNSCLVIDTSYFDHQGELLCFVVLDNAAEQVPNELISEIRGRVERELSKRHIPNEIVAVPALPVTLNGKKLEVPIRKLMVGFESATSLNKGAVANPESLEFFIDFATRRRLREES
jgi:acetoacetyl-CoA synthetase